MKKSLLGEKFFVSTQNAHPFFAENLSQRSKKWQNSANEL